MLDTRPARTAPIPVSSKDEWLRLIGAVAAAALVPFLAAGMLRAPVDGPIGYPAEQLSGPWCLFYGLSALGVTALAGRRTIVVGLFAVVVPVVGCASFGRASAAVWLVLAALAGAKLATARMSKGGVIPMRIAAALATVLALGTTTAYAAMRVSPAEAALAAAPSGDRVIDVFRAPDGRGAVAMVAQGSLSNLRNIGLSLVGISQHAPGYWRADRWETDVASTNGSMDTTIEAFSEHCPMDSQHMNAADAFGACVLGSQLYGDSIPGNGVMAGLAPREAADAVLELSDGRRVRHALKPNKQHGFLFWSSEFGSRELVDRVAFHDANGALLDARPVAGNRLSLWDEQIWIDALHCPNNQCPALNDYDSFSVSVLTRAEYAQFCGKPLVLGKWVAVASVYLIEGREPASPYYSTQRGADQSDRRLLGRDVKRFAIGDGSPVALPSSDAPCFPSARNKP